MIIEKKNIRKSVEHSTENVILESKNRENIAIIKYIGEIRFGPAYYSLELNDKEIKDRIFGNTCLWLTEDLFAIEEWLTIKESEGPMTRLVLFDVKTKTCSNFKVIDKGFVRDPVLNDDKITYRKEYPGLRNVVEAEVDLKNITNWKEY